MIPGVPSLMAIVVALFLVGCSTKQSVQAVAEDRASVRTSGSGPGADAPACDRGIQYRLELQTQQGRGLRLVHEIRNCGSDHLLLNTRLSVQPVAMGKGRDGTVREMSARGSSEIRLEAEPIDGADPVAPCITHPESFASPRDFKVLEPGGVLRTSTGLGCFNLSEGRRYRFRGFYKNRTQPVPDAPSGVVFVAHEVTSRPLEIVAPPSNEGADP